MKRSLYIFIVPILFISCSNTDFKVVSEIDIPVDDNKNKIITAYELNYDPENIDWGIYTEFALSLVENKKNDYEIYFFNKLENTPSLSIQHSIIDTNYQSSCIAKYFKNKDNSFITKYPFKIELGIANIILNEDSTYNISVYAISPFEIAGYQINLAPTNVFTLLSIADKNVSGKHGFATYNNTNMILAFSMYGYTIPKSNSREIKDNILFTAKAKCENQDKIYNTRFHLDSIFSDKDGEELYGFNEPYRITN